MARAACSSKEVFLLYTPCKEQPLSIHRLGVSHFCRPLGKKKKKKFSPRHYSSVLQCQSGQNPTNTMTRNSTPKNKDKYNPKDKVTARKPKNATEKVGFFFFWELSNRLTRFSKGIQQCLIIVFFFRGSSSSPRFLCCSIPLRIRIHKNQRDVCKGTKSKAAEGEGNYKETGRWTRKRRRRSCPVFG